MNYFNEVQRTDKTSPNCSSNASTDTSTFSSNESVESLSCLCDERTQCKPCRLAKGRSYGTKHRLTIKKKNSLLSHERTNERTRSHVLLGELRELRTTIRSLLNSRPTQCITCGAATTPGADVPLGTFLLEQNDTTLSACESRLQECEEHLSNLSEKWISDAGAADRKKRQRAPCSTCDDESCAQCQTRLRSRTYTSKSRAKKDGNLRKCHELLRWSIDELNKHRGQIHCLRKQLKELSSQLYYRCSNQNFNLSVPAFSANSAEIDQGMPTTTAYGRWPEAQGNVFSEQPGWHKAQWPQVLTATADSSNHQAYAHEQHGLTEWELALGTAHEFVMAEQNRAGTSPMTLPSDASLHVGYVLSDAGTSSVAQEVQEVESLLTFFKLEDDDIIPPQTRTGSKRTTATKDPRTRGQAPNKDAQVYVLAEEAPDSDYDTISLGSEASWLNGPRRHSLGSTASMVNNVRSRSISRSASQVSVNDDQGKQEAMQVVCEEDSLTYSVDDSGVRDRRLNSVSLELEKRFYIDHDLIHISRQAIGFGAFATIFKGTLLPRKLESPLHGVTDQTLRDVAIKIRRRRYRANLSRFDYDALREMRILYEIGPNKHLVEPIGYCFKDDEPAFVMEYCERGDLRTYLRTHLRDCKTAVEHITEPLQRHPYVNTQLSLLHLISFCRQISTGMSYLSSRGFVHRLLRAQSILLTSDMTVKIATFSQCVPLSADVYYETDDGYPLLAEGCAPEVLNSTQFSIQSDVWSFGIVLYEIFTAGKTPYSDVGLHSKNGIMRWLAEGHRLEQPELCPPDIYELMLACWRQERLERPGFEKIQRYFERCSGQTCTPRAVSETSNVTQQQCVPLAAK